MSLNQFNWLEEYDDLFKTQESRKLLNHHLLTKDIWHTIDDLNLPINQHHRQFTFNFQEFKPNWFKILFKLYILIRVNQNLSVATIKLDIVHGRKFSRFMQSKYIVLPKYINNNLFEEFEFYLQTQKISQSSIAHNFTTIKNFFDICRREKWLEVDTYWFKHKRGWKKANIKRKKVEYIPEEVWNQLEENLYYLPEQFQRMILIIKSTGLRAGELLTLPLDCLRKRNEQWRLRFVSEKYKTIDELPIVSELATIVLEQKKYIEDNFQDSFQYLFASSSYGGYPFPYFKPTDRVMAITTFNLWLNRLAKEKSIQSKDGHIWKFKSHQFRRTVATVMTNSGVRDLIIQKYLRHRSPDMQEHYKHLLKQVLGDEYNELIKETKYVDSTGKIVSIHKPKNPITELLRRRLHQITTQYGECHRPIIKSPCQTVNACWRCEHWRTSNNDLDYLKQDFSKIENEIAIASKLGMVRQQQGLEEDRNSLSIRIQALEQSNDKN